jgi:hypothetical protein
MFRKNRAGVCLFGRDESAADVSPDVSPDVSRADEGVGQERGGV